MPTERDWKRRLASKAILISVVAFLLAQFVAVFGASFDSAAEYHVIIPPRDFSFVSYQAVPLKYVFAPGVSLIVAHVFVALPCSIGTIAAVLARFNPALEEAAESLGATGWAPFRLVTFPFIRPGVMAGMFYAFIVSFGDVPVALFLVSGEQTTLPVQIFEDMQFDFRPSILAVSSLVAVLSLVAILGMHKLAGCGMIVPTQER